MSNSTPEPFFIAVSVSDSDATTDRRPISSTHYINKQGTAFTREQANDLMRILDTALLTFGLVVYKKEYPRQETTH